MDGFETDRFTTLESSFARASERPGWGETEHDFPSEWEEPLTEDEEGLDASEAIQPWSEKEDGGFASLVDEEEGFDPSRLEGEDPPRNIGVPFAPEPPPGSNWPVRTTHPPGSEISHVAENGGLAGGRQARAFGASRPGRRHCAIDLFGNAGDPVIARQDGQIVNFHPFRGPNAKALIVAHEGVVIDSGGVASDAHTRLGRVTGGQHIAFIGRNPNGSSMLHFETYASGTRDGHKWLAGSNPPPALLEPTRDLLALRKMMGAGRPTPSVPTTPPAKTPPSGGTVPASAAPRECSVPAETPDIPLGTLELSPCAIDGAAVRPPAQPIVPVVLAGATGNGRRRSPHRRSL